MVSLGLDVFEAAPPRSDLFSALTALGGPPASHPRPDHHVIARIHLSFFRSASRASLFVVMQTPLPICPR